MAEWMVTVGDCRDVLAGMEDGSVDAVVCDPPYELSFMGKGWDGTGIAYDVAMWGEVLRVLKPGGHLLAFGGTRTFHRMTVAIEDAGFEIRDCLSWLYGSGFPKSLNVAKSIEGKLTTGSAQKNGFHRLAGEETGGGSIGMYDTVEEQGFRKRQPTQHGARTLDATTPEAARWEGWGTALKPAWEPIVMARKRLVATVAGNVLAHGTGGLNIDGSRIGTDGGGTNCANRDQRGECAGHGNGGRSTSGETVHGPNTASGRWPANVLLDEGAAAALDEQTGIQKDGKAVLANRQREYNATSYMITDHREGDRGYGGSGGASRFFYVAKASRRDRNEGLDGMPERFAPTMGNGIGDKEHDPDAATPRANHHPTVKPTALMRHLVRLVTPPGGLVLDPFTGSGSTGKAAVLEGFRFHGIEQDAEYADIARARIAWAEQQVDAEQPTLL